MKLKLLAAAAILIGIFALMCAGIYWQHEKLVAAEARNEELAKSIATLKADLEVQKNAAELAAENARMREAEIKAVRSRASVVFRQEENRAWGSEPVPADVRGLLVQGARGRNTASEHSK